jgi:very long chain acyl-CoA dehydrogenase
MLLCTASRVATNLIAIVLQTPVKDKKTGEIKDKITSFIVERNFKGVTR